MKISEITIEGLFGYFDHKIQMKNEDRITIVHGPNGVGKTTLLRLVYSLFQKQFSFLFHTPFKRIVVKFAPEGEIQVKRSSSRRRSDRTKSTKLTLRYLAKGGKELDFVLQLKPLEGEHRISALMIERSVPFVDRIGVGSWYDRRTDQRMSTEEVVFHYHNLFPQEIRSSVFSDIPEEIEDMLNKFNIVIVETQRLFAEPVEDSESMRGRRREGVKRITTVERYSQDLVSRIQECHSESAKIGSSLDVTFPERLLEQKARTLSEKKIREKYERLSVYRERLMNAGLFAAKTVSLPSTNLEDHEKRVLSIYLEDVDKKLGEFDYMLEKVELFKDIVNTRFSYKNFTVDRESGFIFRSEHDGSEVPPHALSSGEQHEIVLTYRLLFESAPGSLIFIDEPELSLHVSWQRKFLDDIARISQTADLDFLIATHSPSIVQSRRSLLVSLGN